jgi:hypothetical protein
VSIGYKNRSAILPVCTPVFAGDTRRFCRPELFQLQAGIRNARKKKASQFA